MEAFRIRIHLAHADVSVLLSCNNARRSGTRRRIVVWIEHMPWDARSLFCAKNNRWAGNNLRARYFGRL